MLAIDSDADLELLVAAGPPAFGAEGATVDFKRELGNPHDTAIDIAALANTDGGLLIFGVDERDADGNRGGIAQRFSPVDPAAVEAHVTRAVTGSMHGLDSPPRPYRAAVPGGHVVAFYVPPSARIVSVRGKGSQESMRFPIRLGADNDYMDLAQVEERMGTTPWRAMMLRIADARKRTARQGIQLWYVVGRRDQRNPYAGTATQLKGPQGYVQSIEIDGDLRPFGVPLKFTLSGERMGVQHVRMDLPYDWVSTVWIEPGDGVDPGEVCILVLATVEWSGTRPHALRVTPDVASMRG